MQPGRSVFLRVYDQAFGEIAQGGTRRGANMGVLRVDHPDIEEFISCKAEEGVLSNFNISVALTDEFMDAVIRGEDFDLRNPRNGEVVKTVKARGLFDMIVSHAHRNGEPGALFIDTANRSNPVPHLYDLEATNPCGEQWLGPYENCCLGSVNLSLHVTEGADGGVEVDWGLLRRTVREGTHFLDNVVSANAYLPVVPAVQDAALRARRIGLGIMGLADLMYKLGIGYGSEMGQEFAAQVMEFVRYHCMQKSIELAAERGSFPAIDGSIYDYSDGWMYWRPPQPDSLYRCDWKRPQLEWDKICEGIRQNGIRNAAQTTVAPTGTISTVSGCEGYGCEPVFALGYVRHFKDDDQDVNLFYTSPLFEAALARWSWTRSANLRFCRKWLNPVLVRTLRSCRRTIRDTFVVSADISAEQHVGMQAAIQAFVDNSISKTCNFPEGATQDDVAQAYMQAWDLGCKGLTVYVTGSRQEVVLETKAVKGELLREPDALVKRPRPYLLQGKSYRKETPLGNAYVTINSDEQGEPFEVFLNVGKGGSDVTAVSEAIGRLISLLLRMPSAIPQSERLRWVVDEMEGIGGGRPLGFGADRVRSLPDGVAQVLRSYLGDLAESVEKVGQIRGGIGDLCPECGEASFLNVEGCRKCNVCGYSEC